MSQRSLDPDWDSPLPLSLTPAAISGSVLGSADEVHTSWQSCVDEGLIVAETLAHDAHTTNYCRLVEQEYEEDGSDGIWHDWCVELRFGEVYVSGHWRLLTDARGCDWAWCNEEAQKAFATGCALVGRRVGRTVFVEENLDSGPPPTRH